MRKRNFLVVAGVCLATLSLTVSSALADPLNPTGPRLLPGVGSDTTQTVMNGYANGTAAPLPVFGGIVGADGTTKIVASYDATGSATITTRNTPQCTDIPRPNGSSAGVNALAGLNPAFPAACASFARSSNNDSASRPGQGLTYIPFANDGLTYSTLTQSNVAKSLTLDQLRTIFRRNITEGCLFEPRVPQAGSGTRAFWNTLVGPFGTCVLDTDDNGAPIQEHDGRTTVTNPRRIMPFGVGPWVSQSTQPSVPDRRGLAILRAINGESPFDLSDFPGARPLFNVVRTADVGNPDIIRAFGTAAQGGQICLNPQVLEGFALSPHPNCGSIAIQTP